MATYRTVCVPFLISKDFGSLFLQRWSNCWCFCTKSLPGCQRKSSTSIPTEMEREIMVYVFLRWPLWPPSSPLSDSIIWPADSIFLNPDVLWLMCCHLAAVQKRFLLLLASSCKSGKNWRYIMDAELIIGLCQKRPSLKEEQTKKISRSKLRAGKLALNSL